MRVMKKIYIKYSNGIDSVHERSEDYAILDNLVRKSVSREGKFEYSTQSSKEP